MNVPQHYPHTVGRSRAVAQARKRRLRSPVLIGLVLAALAVLVGIVLGPVFEQISKPNDPSALARISGLSVTAGTIAGLLAGRVLGTALPRYIRTRGSTPTLVDDGLVVIVVSVLCSLGLSYLLSLQPVLAIQLNLINLIAPFLVTGSIATVLSWPLHRRPAFQRSGTGLVLPFSDRPLERLEEDQLHRHGVLHLLEELIAEQREARGSLVIAIDGPWGVGKTSLLNFLERRLQCCPDNYVVVRFDPWSYDDPPALLSGFFAALSEEVSRRYLLPDLQVEAGRYLAALGPTLSRLGVSFDPLRRRNVDTLRRALAQLTDALPAHVVVILDDLDRLQKPELLATLRLMKLSAVMPNLTYVAGIHVEPVVKYALNDQLPGYLDKFLDVVVPLSVLDREDIKTYFRREAHQVAQASRVRSLRGVETLDRVVEAHIAATPTIRDVKRVLAGFKNALQQLPGEVNAEDVLMLEILRWRAPLAWQAISDRPEYFHRATVSDDILDVAMAAFFRDGEAWRQARRHYYEEMLDGVPSERREPLRQLIKDIFPYFADAGTGRAEVTLEDKRLQRARHPDYFRRYFLFRLAATTVPDVEVDELVRRLNELGGCPESDAIREARSLISNMLDRHTGEEAQVLDHLVVRAAQIAAPNRTVLALAVASTSHRWSKTVRSTWDGSPEDRAIALVLSLAREEEHDSGIQAMLERLINESPSLVFSSQVVTFTDPFRNHIFENWSNVDRARLEQRYQERLRADLLINGVDMFEEYPQFWPRLARTWTDRTAKHEYLESLANANPSRIGDMLAWYRGRGRTIRDEPVLNVEEIAADWDFDQLCKLVASLGVLAAVGDEAEAAIQEMVARCAARPASLSRPGPSRSRRRRVESTEQ